MYTKSFQSSSYILVVSSFLEALYLLFHFKWKKSLEIKRSALICLNEESEIKRPYNLLKLAFSDDKFYKDGFLDIIVKLLLMFSFIVSLYLFCGRLLEAVSLAIVKMVSHIILSVIFAVLKAIFQKFFEQIRFSPTSSNSILNFFSHSSRNASLGNTSRNSTICKCYMKYSDKSDQIYSNISQGLLNWVNTINKYLSL